MFNIVIDIVVVVCGERCIRVCLGVSEYVSGMLCKKRDTLNAYR